MVRGGGAAVGDRAEVALFGTGGVGAPVLRLLVMEGADGADRVVVLADWSGVPIPLAVAAASGLVGGVSDFNLPLAGEEKDVRAHFLTFLRGGGNHHGGGVLEGSGVRVWIEEASRGDCRPFGVEDSRFEVDEQPLGVARQVSKGEVVDGDLIFIRGGAEGELGRGADWEGLVEASCKGREEGGVIRGGGRRVNP